MPQATLTPAAVEVLPGIFRLGDTIPVEGKISWAPKSAKFQHLNSYLALESDSATLFDTCPAVLEKTVVAQLESVLPKSTPLSVFLTRAEYEVIGNLGAIHAVHPIKQLYAGGVANIFDAYNEIAGFSKRWEERTYVDRILPGTSITVGDSDRFEVLGVPLRLLTSFWVYDRETKAMFSTDSFGFTSGETPDYPLIVSSPDEDPSTLESVREHVLARYPWVAWGDTQTVSKHLASIFEKREISALLPCHGSMLVGRETVQRHYDYLQTVLNNGGDKA